MKDRSFGKIIALFLAASILTSCSGASKNSSDSSKDSISSAGISDTGIPAGADPDAPKYANASSATSPYEPIFPIENPLKGTELEQYCTDNFVVLDNNSGYVNVYEIEPEIPMHLTKEWNRDHPRADANMTFIESTNWTYEYDRIWVLWWFMGKSINESTKPADYESRPGEWVEQNTYTPPDNVFAGVIEGMHVSTISSIPNWMELPFRTSVGRVNPDNHILVLDLDGSVFPREATSARGEPALFPEDYDTLHFISLTDKYIDNVPVYGSLYCIAEPWGVYDYEDILHTARGTNLITTITCTYQDKDTVVQMVRTGDFTVKNVLKQNLHVLPLSECVEGIKEAAEYFNNPPNNWTLDRMTFYCAELSYLPFTNYDITTYDYTDERTYLIPVWNLYLYVDGQPAPGFCLTVDATTGKCLYSKEYSLYDERLEKPDPEMTN
ncbi:MAG: hypothetical protein J5379_11225 [Clostridiales bacterium]|nr:hypothetical protein [Clostridiales bacterium]